MTSPSCAKKPGTALSQTGPSGGLHPPDAREVPRPHLFGRPGPLDPPCFRAARRPTSPAPPGHPAGPRVHAAARRRGRRRATAPAGTPGVGPSRPGRSPPHRTAGPTGPRARRSRTTSTPNRSRAATTTSCASGHQGISSSSGGRAPSTVPSCTSTSRAERPPPSTRPMLGRVEQSWCARTGQEVCPAAGTRACAGRRIGYRTALVLRHLHRRGEGCRANVRAARPTSGHGEGSTAM